MSTPKRTYTSAIRADQARQTRQRVIAAAHRQFVAHGYTDTSIEAIARDAEVSQQTIYNTVGNKAALLAVAYDAALAGDEETVAIADRPEFQAVLAATDAHNCLELYAALGRQLAERAAPLVAMILAESGNPEVRALAASIEEQRAQGTRTVARHIAKRFGLRSGLTAKEASDVLWTLTAPEIPSRLIRDRKWTWGRYQDWFTDTLTNAMLDPAT